MKFENLSAIEIGKLVNNKTLKATEVIDYFANRITVRNPSINAFVYTKFDEAIEEAKKLDNRISNGEYCGPFAGVPFGLKEFLPTKKGWKSWHGGVKCLESIDKYDSEFCKAIESLGGIAIGKTNAPSFGFRATCDNKMFGPTSTPFKVGYNSGGSSGGSASAVADGLVPLSEAGDAGGSIRCPGAWCGVFGFKPSAGVVPSVCRPDAWAATHPYCCGGPISRTVSDAAFVVNKMIQYNPRDPLSVPIGIDVIDALDRSTKEIRIGYSFDFNLFPDPEEEIKSAMISVFDKLKREVICVEPVSFNFKHSKEEMEEAWLRGINIDTAICNKLAKERGFDLIKDHADELPEALIKWNNIAIDSNMMDYRKFHEVRTDILDAHIDVFDKYDIILAPVTGCLPVKNSDDFDTKGPEYISGVKVDPLIGFAYTYLENMIGTPAASIPIGLSKEGLPVGLQVIGRRYEDDWVFAICSLLEKINPWSYGIPFNRKI